MPGAEVCEAMTVFLNNENMIKIEAENLDFYLYTITEIANYFADLDLCAGKNDFLFTSTEMVLMAK